MQKGNSNHQIQKFTFDLGFDSEKLAYQFQSEFSAFVKEQILPLTESILEQYGKDKNIRIGKLELDLGDFSQEGFNENFYRKYKERLSDKLRLILSGYDINSPDEKPEIISSSKNQYEILLYFFQKGILPWNSASSESVNFINRQFTELFETTPTKAKQLVESIISDSNFRIRLIRHIEDEIYWKVIQAFYTNEIDWIKKWVFDFISLFKQKKFLSNTESEFKEKILEFVLLYITSKKVKPTNQEIISKEFVRFISDNYKIETTKVVVDLLSSLGLQAEIKNGKPVLSAVNGNNFQNSLSLDLVEVLKQLFLKNEDGFITLESINISNENFDFENSKIEFPFEGALGDLRKNDSGFTEEQKSYLNTLSLQRISAIVSLVKHYFGYANELQNVALIKSLDIKLINSYLKDIIAFNPSVLKRILQDTKFDLSSYSNLWLIEQIDPTVRKKILFDIFEKEESEFAKEKLLAEGVIVKKFLMNGFLTEPTISKKTFTALAETVLKNKQIVKEIIEHLRKLSKDKIFLLVQQWQWYVEDSIIMSHFNEFFEPHSKVESNNIPSSSSISTEELINVELESNSFEFLIQLLNKIIVTNKMEEFADVWNNSIEKLLTNYESRLIAYLDNLSPKVYKKILKYLKKDVVDKIELYKKNIEVEVERLVNEKNKVVELEEKINELKSLEKQAVENKKEILPEIKIGEPVYINNAGMVILHPYLNMLFKKFDLLNKKEFKDEFSMHKAVHILQYLANKSVGVEEHELVLNKILCGMNLAEPLRRDIEITDEEKEVCESLLVALIDNWSILKKTSPDNLRSSFFIREGRLLLESMGWKLRVEEKGYDILVEKLPWSIAMIKLPWMKNIVYVEWK